MYGHTLLISKTNTSAIDFVLVMRGYFEFYDFDDAPIAT